MSTSQRNMTSASVKAIMSKRSTIPETAVGKRVKFFVQGDGNIVDARNKDGELVLSTIPGYEGTVLQKKIFNLKANSGLAMLNERTRSYIKNGITAEKLGGEATVHGELGGVEGDYTAHQWFNAYLNACQMSFGILLPNAIVDKLTSGVEIAASVQKITTDNGSLLTIDPSTISIVEPESYGTVSFNLEDFTAELDADAAKAEADAKAAAALAKKNAKKATV